MSADFNNDGTIDICDLDYLLKNWKKLTNPFSLLNSITKFLIVVNEIF